LCHQDQPNVISVESDQISRSARHDYSPILGVHCRQCKCILVIKLFCKTLRLNQSFLLDQQDQYISHLVQDQCDQHFNAANQISSAISSAQRIQ